MSVAAQPTPSYLEDRISQVPALRLLIAMGWTYLTPDEANHLRGHKNSSVLLTGVLADWLRAHNRIDFRGSHPFSEANIDDAIRRLSDVPLQQGLVRASEDVYALLAQGVSLPQEIAGHKSSYNFRYIDWRSPANNVYHVTDEFSVERQGSKQTRRPDIVLFVNGIPLAVIECKRPDQQTANGKKAVYAGVEQHLRNQDHRDEIPRLFAYAQLLMAVSTNDALYATAGTPEKFWATWHEEHQDDSALTRLINAPLSEGHKVALYGWRQYGGPLRQYFDRMDAAGDRLPTAQDRAIAALLAPPRLLELAYGYIVYDNGQKKIARYQQYFAIKATLAKVAQLGSDGMRAGGVIWHTTGSGKSLTMVMLAKALLIHLHNRRVVIVTDRIDLDTQIWRTFDNCGESVSMAGSGAHLIELIRAPRHSIITTVIDKFEGAAKAKRPDPSPDVFVLVDESHRSQYGSSHAKMREVFPNGCYIGFTGTPLLRKEKGTAERFGGFIHKYTMRQAVQDGAVVPLIYEGRIVDLDVDRDKLDTWFERRTADLNEAQKTDLKRKMSRAEEIHRTDSRTAAIAWDIAQHFQANVRDEAGFKAQLATSSREQAIVYRTNLRDEGINCEVVMSTPDTREGTEDLDESAVPRVLTFWRQMMEKYGTPENYVREVKQSFAGADGVEILIVVDMLLVGFDEPRNTVLYIDKPLREHGLLQAIARVNRLYEGKDYGYIIDYRGVLGQLNEALDTYNALEEYDSEDVAGTVTDVAKVLAELPGAHESLWAFFNPVPAPRGNEDYERYLEPEDRRQAFYEHLHAFARLFKVALSTIEFYQRTPEARIQQYKKDLTFFHQLRQSVQLRYAETISYSDYEQKIRKLLNDHVRAAGVEVLTPEVNIFDEAAFSEAVAHLGTPAARADAIANKIRKTATERVEEDPAFYRKFSKMVEDTIEAYRTGRMTELDYLQHMEAALDEFRAGHANDLPPQLAGTLDAVAYYGMLSECFADGDPDALANLAAAIEAGLNRHKIRDWTANPDITDRMKGTLDDLIFESIAAGGQALEPAALDALIDQLVEVARHRELAR